MLDRDSSLPGPWLLALGNFAETPRLKTCDVSEGQVSLAFSG